MLFIFISTKDKSVNCIMFLYVAFLWTEMLYYCGSARKTVSIFTITWNKLASIFFIYLNPSGSIYCVYKTLYLSLWLPGSGLWWPNVEWTDAVARKTLLLLGKNYCITKSKMWGSWSIFRWCQLDISYHKLFSDRIFISSFRTFKIHNYVTGYIKLSKKTQGWIWDLVLL